MKKILLGRNKQSGKGVYITPKDRSTHMHVIGSTGVGKTKFLEHLIREDIKNNHGLCLIDPHGGLYEDIIRWSTHKGFIGRKKIVLFDPAEAGWTFGFNPLKASPDNLSYHVDSMVQACAKVWGGEDTSKTPLLKRCLRVVFHILAEKQLSLLEARHIINPTSSEFRDQITRDIKDEVIRQQWAYFNTLKEKQFNDEFGSSINRIMEFLSSPIIRNIVGQTEKTINFQKIMDEGHILLVNLAPRGKISQDNTHLLGTLIVNDLLLNALGRPLKSKPFYLYIDECSLFINKDIGRILDECRKFGLHLILAHQHLSQLKKAGEDIYSAVMADAKTKVVFGGLATEDAEVLTKKICIGEFDLEEPKAVLNKPTVVGYIKTWLQNESRGSSISTGESRGGGDSYTNTGSVSVNPEGDESTTTGSSSSFSNSYSTTETSTESYSEGRSETYLPEMELLPTSVYSLEEQVYKFMALMVNQPTQRGIIKLPGQATKFIKTPTIKPVSVRVERIQKFKDDCFNLAEFSNPTDDIQQILEGRLKQMQGLSELTTNTISVETGEYEADRFRDSQKPTFPRKK